MQTNIAYRSYVWLTLFIKVLVFGFITQSVARPGLYKLLLFYFYTHLPTDHVTGAGMIPLWAGSKRRTIIGTTTSLIASQQRLYVEQRVSLYS